MEILFLGTGASPATPLPFCRCSFCQEMRAKGQFRRRASLLINRDLLIDLGPDIPAAAAAYNVDLTNVSTVLETHSHDDHFNAELFASRIPGYAAEAMPEVLLMADAQALARMRQKLVDIEGDADILDETAAQQMGLLVRALTPGRWAYTCRYEILPLAVPHDTSSGSVIYVIRDTSDGTAVLYATDSPPFGDDVWQALRSLRLDAAILDATFGVQPHLPSKSHMDHADVAATAARLRSEGILRTKAPVYATHISHEGHGSIEAMETYARENGFLLAEDGLHLTVQRLSTAPVAP